MDGADMIDVESGMFGMAGVDRNFNMVVLTGIFAWLVLIVK